MTAGTLQNESSTVNTGRAFRLIAGSEIECLKVCVCVCVCVCVWVVERQSIFLYQIKAGLLMCSVSAHSALSVLRTDSVTGVRQKTFLFLWPLCSSPPVSSCRSAHTLSFWCNCLSEKKKKKESLMTHESYYRPSCDNRQHGERKIQWEGEWVNPCMWAGIRFGLRDITVLL